MGRGAHGAAVSTDIQNAIANVPDETRVKMLRAAKGVFHFVCSHALALVALPLVATGTVHLVEMHQQGILGENVVQLWESAQNMQLELSLWAALAVQGAVLVVAAALFYLLGRPRRTTYLLNWYSYRPPERMQVTKEMMLRGIVRSGRYDEQAITFMDKVMEISGLGPKTYLPDEVVVGMTQDVDLSVANKRRETESVLFNCTRKLLEKTGVRAQDIDALIVNCCTFNPTPSLSAAVVNHFRMKTSCKTYNLSGMGCSASVIAVDLANELLKNNANMRVLVVGTENILDNLYFGKQRSMLITNCIFRLGGVAFLMTNRRADRPKCKYELQHVVRTHLGASDEAYNCVMQKEDDDGELGMKIGRDLMQVAGKALRVNITTLGPLVLPISEQLIFAGNFLARKVLRMDIKPYIPDFTLAFEHFCIHPGGKAVIEEVGKQLKLRESQLLPMLVPFERFGNTSSSSTWYAWSYVETLQGVKKGERVWQLSFGSGFKCNSAVWRALRAQNEQHDAWTDTPCDH